MRSINFLLTYFNRDCLPWAVQKWLNRSRCRLGRGLGWVQGIKLLGAWPDQGQFWAGKGMPRHARRHSDVSCAKTAELIERPNTISLSVCCAAMRPYVKLRWPLVIIIIVIIIIIIIINQMNMEHSLSRHWRLVNNHTYYSRIITRQRASTSTLCHFDCKSIT